MRKLIIAAFVVAPSLLLAQDDFTVSGRAGTLDSPAKAFISYRTETGVVLDSTNVEKGVFTFNGSVTSPTRGMLFLMHDGGDVRDSRDPDRIELYLEKGNITVQTADSLINGEVKAGPLNDNFNAYKVLSAGPKNKMDELILRFSNATDEDKQDPQFMMNIQAEASNIQEEQKSVDLTFIQDNPNSQVSVDLLIPYLDSEPINEVIEPIFNKLSDELKNSETGNYISERITTLRSVDIGAMAPEFSQPDTAGNQIALSSLKGKYVLIDFWASWCGPCRQENPNVVAAYHKFKDKNFTIFGVSLDRPGQKEAWMKAIHDDGLADWPHVSELKFWQSDVVEQYAIRGIPQNFLLDPTGKIIAKNLRGEELHEALEALLK